MALQATLLAVAALVSVAPASAARSPAAVMPPPITLPAAMPIISASIAGQPVRLTVDFGGEPVVILDPAAATRLRLAEPARPTGGPVERGLFRVAVGQTMVSIPYSREMLEVDGARRMVRVLTPARALPEQVAGSDGVIGLPLLPHQKVTLQLRPPSPADAGGRMPTRIDRSSSALVVLWPLPGPGGPLDVEFHPLRARSVASAAAASRLADALGGHLVGPVQRIEVGFGVSRPVRRMRLARPLVMMGVQLAEVDVRLFDWAGRSELPPDADGADESTVTGRRGRQRGWPILKLGQDVLSACASISWERGRAGRMPPDSDVPAAGWLDISCTR